MSVSLPFEEVEAAAGRSGAVPRAVPLLPMDVAAGGFSRDRIGDGVRWVRPHTVQQLQPGHFVARVTGRSMEPLVPEGSYALFVAPVGGDPQGRVLLVRRDGIVDDDTGASYTLKRFEGEHDARQGWRSVRLVPANPAYRTVTLDPGRGDRFEAVAEMLEVLGVDRGR